MLNLQKKVMLKFLCSFALALPVFLHGQSVIHYWHFNNLSGQVDSVAADFSALAELPYITYPGTGAGYMDDVSDGDSINLRQGQNAGNGLRVRNPSDVRQLILPLPTDDFEDISFSYAVKRTNNGAQTQWLSFSVDGGTTWSNAMPFGDSIAIETDYVLQSFDFSSVAAANDNSDFMVRIEFFDGSSSTAGNNRFDNIVLEGNSIVAPPTSNDLIHYWHFNTLSGVVNDPVDADFTLNPDVIPNIDYVGVGDGYMDDYGTGSPLNLQRNNPPGVALRVRNPSFNRALIIELPTTDCEDISLVYDVHRSGSGMLFNNIAYSVDGVNYDTTGLSIKQVAITETYQTFTFDFSDIAAANDNPNFKVRITWDGNTNQSNGNNRYDNVAMFAGQTTLSTNAFTQSNSNLSVYPNPATDVVLIKWDITAPNYEFSVLDMTGKAVMTGEHSSRIEQQINVSELSKGVYHLLLEGNNEVITKKIIVK